LEHGRASRSELQRAAAADEEPNLVALVRAWGGATIAYRKSMLDSPAYRLNHEEIIKSLEEGITYAENLSPVEAVPDEFGHVKGLVFSKQIYDSDRWRDSGEIVEMPARAVMVAAGTSPNVIYEKEHPGTFKLDRYGQFFQSYAVSGAEPIEGEGFFTSYQRGSKRITFYGDNHPKYAGNVVKAMASAKDGYPHIASLFDSLAPADESKWRNLVR